MSKKEKQLRRILSLPKDYTYSECSTLLRSLGYEEYNKGRTSGSRVRFYRKEDGHVIDLHKPHPGDVMLPAAVKAVVATLRQNGDV